MKDCIFCKISKKEAPAKILYEDDLVMAIMEIDPITDGHTIIIPKKDIKNIHHLDSETGKRIMEISKKIAGAIENEFSYDGSMIMGVNGEFQDVPHFHLHVFGRSKKNDIRYIWPKDINKAEEHISECEKRLKKYMG